MLESGVVNSAPKRRGSFLAADRVAVVGMRVFISMLVKLILCTNCNSFKGLLHVSELFMLCMCSTGSFMP